MQYFMNEHIDIFQYNLEAFRYNMNSRRTKDIISKSKKSIFVYLNVFKDQNQAKFK